MKILTDSLPWATIGLYVLTALYAVVGGIEVIRGQLDFEKYGTLLAGFAVAFGILGVGRGIASKDSPPAPKKK